MSGQASHPPKQGDRGGPIERVWSYPLVFTEGKGSIVFTKLRYKLEQWNILYIHQRLVIPRI